MELDEITYPISKKSVERFPIMIEEQTKTLKDLGLSDEEIQRALAPTISFMEGVKEDVKIYEEKMRQRNT